MKFRPREFAMMLYDHMLKVGHRDRDKMKDDAKAYLSDQLMVKTARLKNLRGSNNNINESNIDKTLLDKYSCFNRN
jgi:hypothetical protein